MSSGVLPKDDSGGFLLEVVSRQTPTLFDRFAVPREPRMRRSDGIMSSRAWSVCGSGLWSMRLRSPLQVPRPVASPFSRWHCRL